MICESIDYYNFRNIEFAHIELSPGVNVFYGNNAEGKTNAVEGIYLFAGGRSFRAHSDGEMVRFGERACGIKLGYRDKNGSGTLEFGILPNGKRSCKKNGFSVSRLSEFVGCFHAVLFCPEHLSVVKDGPSARRSFLDMAISQLSPVYLASLQRYHMILRQRNSLLKQKMFSGGNIDKNFSLSVEVWSEQLAREAAYISKVRYAYVEKLCKRSAYILSDMTSGKDEISLLYPEPYGEEVFFEKLSSSLEREVRMGGTLYGIHKDDMIIKIGGRDARSFASQGQQRSSALSLKLAEGEIIKDDIGEYPVFLLDDILSELDESRKKYIMDGLKDRQTVITSCGNEIGGNRRFFVSGGTYTVTG